MKSTCVGARHGPGRMEDAVKGFLHQAWGSRSADTFPGPHPVSIERKHLGLLRSQEYVVCEKTDGIRYLLVCLTHEDRKYAVFVNRKLDMTPVQLAIPRNTILDGELIGDTFMIFDAIMVNGKDLRELSFLDRLREAEKVTKGPPFKIRLKMKTMWPARAAAEVWSRSKDNADGLIFTPVREPVRMETHETMFKWKPMERITVDFKVHEGYMCIWDRLQGLIKVQKTSAKDGTILECKYVSGEWVPEKIRVDKDMPNNRRTMMRTLVNIKEDIKVSEF